MIDEETENSEVIYYSAQDNGFVFLAEREAYDAAGTWPEDAVRVTAEEWHTYGQQPPPKGMRRGSDSQGRPAWVRPEVTLEDATAHERAWRNRQLSVTDSLVVRHRDELETVRLTTLSTEQYQQLQLYRLDLRNWPVAELFPDFGSRPAPPAWLSESTE